MKYFYLFFNILPFHNALGTLNKVSTFFITIITSSKLKVVKIMFIHIFVFNIANKNIYNC